MARFFLTTIKDGKLVWEEYTKAQFNRQKELFGISEAAENDKIDGFIGHQEHSGQIYWTAGTIRR